MSQDARSAAKFESSGVRGPVGEPLRPSSNRAPDTSAAPPQYVYAESREEAQRLLDNSYLKKYRAVPVRWWRWWLRV